MVIPKFQKSGMENPPTGHFQEKLLNKQALNKHPLKRIISLKRLAFSCNQGGAFPSNRSLVKMRTVYQACSVLLGAEITSAVLLHQVWWWREQRGFLHFIWWTPNFCAFTLAWEPIIMTSQSKRLVILSKTKCLHFQPLAWGNQGGGTVLS